jgi:hypothetical protein
MMTADEARKLASEEDKLISKQFEEVERYVNEAVLNGFFSVTIVGQLHKYIKKHLENLGYNVLIFDDSYSINWAQ